MKRKASLSKRAQGEANVIRSMFMATSEMDKVRTKEGLDPLISLSIGAPPIPSNPLVDIVMANWVRKKTKLRETVANLEKKMLEGDEQRKNNEQEYKKHYKKLVQIDTYQLSQGTPKCRQAAADLLNHYYPSLKAEAANCCITNGCTNALTVLFQAFIDPGVTVAAFAPYYPPYKKTIESFGGNWITIPTTENCRPSTELFAQYLSKHNVSIFVLNDPCNPSGAKFTRQELTAISEVLLKPEFRHIIIVSDETYHDLIFTEKKELFLHVADMEEFRARTCITLSMSKGIAGCPGLRFGVAYAPDMQIDGKLERMGNKLGILMLDTTSAVSSPIQYVGEKILTAKLGKGKPEWIKIHKEWEEKTLNMYSNLFGVANSLFSKDSKLSFVLESKGAFFGLLSGKYLLGKTVPTSTKLLDGRTVTDLPSKVQTDTFKTDLNVANFLIHAAEVVTVPAFEFGCDTHMGLLRVSMVSEEVLREVARRIEHAVGQVH